MSELQLQESLFLYPTPAGSYYAVASPEHDAARTLLRSLFQLRATPLANTQTLHSLINNRAESELIQLLKSMQDLGWLQGCDQEQQAPHGPLEDMLPSILEPLSDQGTVLLADNLGLNIAHTGFDATAVEQLSALSADVSILHDRHLELLKNKLDLNSGAWGIVDAAGNSQTGFWPMHIGKHRFVLVIGGLPLLNQFNFTSLIWALSIRYGANES